jgi:hypothetical protein
VAVGAAAAAAAIAQAVKASGVVVRLEPAEFMRIVGRVPEPLLVIAEGGLFNKNYQYLMGYKGLAFYTKSGEPLQLPATAEVTAARSIWIPG